MSSAAINQLTVLTLAYLEADSGEMLHHQQALEEYLRQADNSEKQIKFWMVFCLELEGDQNGDLHSVMTTDAMVSVLEATAN